MSTTTTIPASPSPASYVDWPAIFAGAAIASAIVFLLLSFGGAIGLGLTSTREGEGIGGTGFIIAVGLWTIWATVSAHMAGAYVTGRLRRRLHDSSEHESDIRDGLHGLIVWALGLLIGASLLIGGAYTAAKAGGEAASATSTVLEKSDFSPQRYLADTLLRTPNARDAQTDNATAEEVARIFQASATDGTVSEQDRAYLTSVLASRTGMSEEDANARVNEVIARFNTLVEDAKAAAETARQASVVTAFIIAATLLIAAAGAWWAATAGGNHRDEETVIPLLSRRT